MRVAVGRLPGRGQCREATFSITILLFYFSDVQNSASRGTQTLFHSPNWPPTYRITLSPNMASLFPTAI